MSVADRLNLFGTTIFAEMTQLAADHDAINLGQGFPNWAGADFVKDAAIRSISDGLHDQYPPTAGVTALREAISRRYGPFLGRTIDPEDEVTVTSGCTEALAASFLGLVNPGDEVILIEPYYDAYPAYAAMAGAIPRFARLRPPGFTLDLNELRRAFNPRTKVIVLNNPHNPTGRVFSLEELRAIAELCLEFDVLVIADEVYEEMTYEVGHIRIATLPGMWERTLTLSSLGKTFSLTGWKLGWAIGPANLTAGFETFGFGSDRKFARHMAENVGVVAIPPSVFYDNPSSAANLIRFAFCKDESTLNLALDRLSVLPGS